MFFTCSGSEAVDTAMKIALAYHRARGEGGRTMFVSRERAYHGVNMGGVALSGILRNRESFGPGVAGVVHMRHTALPENRMTRGQPARGAELRRRAVAKGRDPRTISISVYGAPPDADLLRQYRDAGVTRAIFGLPSAPADKVLPIVDRCAEVARQVASPGGA